MKRIGLVACAVLASLPSVALADGLDLTGAWSAAVSGYKQAPPSAVFSGKKTSGGAEAYRLSIVARQDDDVTTLDLAASWDGSRLRVAVAPATVSTPGFVGALASDPFAGGLSSSAKTAIYELEAKGDLDKLVLVSGSLPKVTLPRELRRPKAPDVRSPAEWEQAEEILWGHRDEFKVSRIYAAAIKATANENVRHWVYFTSAAAQEQVEYEFAEAGVPMNRVRFAEKKFQTVWMRDYGPIVLKQGSKRIVGDMGYFPDRPRDDFVPTQYAKQRGWERRDVESLKLEGGNYLTDGKGRLFTTNRSLEANPSQAHVEARLRELGAREVIFMERMPEPEGTGHVDMFAKLVDEKTVLVGRCDSPASFKAVLDRNADRFAKLGYKVVRVDMADGKKLMTYTNSLFVGKTVLVPTYNVPERDKAALDVYKKLGWKPVGIDARSVITANGAIHCISMQVAR